MTLLNNVAQMSSNLKQKGLHAVIKDVLGSAEHFAVRGFMRIMEENISWAQKKSAPINKDITKRVQEIRLSLQSAPQISVRQLNAYLNSYGNSALNVKGVWVSEWAREKINSAISSRQENISIDSLLDERILDEIEIEISLASNAAKYAVLDQRRKSLGQCPQKKDSNSQYPPRKRNSQTPFQQWTIVNSSMRRPHPSPWLQC